MLSSKFLVLPIAVVLCRAQTPQTPQFDADGVRPLSESSLSELRGIPLAPARLMSIHGHALGPEEPCYAQVDPQQHEVPSPLRPDRAFVDTLVYPKALCGVEVLLGDVPAGLRSVQAERIDFKVPQEMPIDGTAELRVMYRGQSKVVTMPLGLVRVSLASQARVGFPIWLKISAYEEIRYPFYVIPDWHVCHDVEVRKDGRADPPDYISEFRDRAWNYIWRGLMWVDIGFGQSPAS